MKLFKKRFRKITIGELKIILYGKSIIGHSFGSIQSYLNWKAKQNN